MEILVDRCAGIDLGKADMKVCVRTPGRRAGLGWRGAHVQDDHGGDLGGSGLAGARAGDPGRDGVDRGLLEAGVLSAGRDRGVLAAQCRASHKVPGRKSDVTDAQWIAQLLECGLVSPSFVPPGRSVSCGT